MTKREYKKLQIHPIIHNLMNEIMERKAHYPYQVLSKLAVRIDFKEFVDEFIEIVNRDYQSLVLGLAKKNASDDFIKEWAESYYMADMNSHLGDYLYSVTATKAFNNIKSQSEADMFSDVYTFIFTTIANALDQDCDYVNPICSYTPGIRWGVDKNGDELTIHVNRGITLPELRKYLGQEWDFMHAIHLNDEGVEVRKKQKKRRKSIPPNFYRDILIYNKFVDEIEGGLSVTRAYASAGVYGEENFDVRNLHTETVAEIVKTVKNYIELGN